MTRMTPLATLALSASFMLLAQGATADPTKFTMSCTGDGAQKLNKEQFTCKIDMAHSPTTPNPQVPKSVSKISYIFMEVEGEAQPGGPVCPTWVFKNGQWVRIC